MTASDPRALYLGIDAGGTKTAWRLCRAGRSVASGGAAAIQVAQLGVEAAARALFELLAEVAAHGPVRAAAAGLAGAGSSAVRAELRAALRRVGVRTRLHLAGDPEIAAASALAQAPGVALWAGTGSFAIARSERGELHRVGGRGWLLGDQGSAFDLARRAAAAVMAAHDGLAPATALGSRLCAALGCAVLDLPRTLQAKLPAAIAQLYPEVRAAAEAGDEVALAVQREGAAALATLALGAARRAELPPTAPVWLGGGLLVRDPPMRELLAAALLARGASAPQLSECDAALGAARLAEACELDLAPMSRWLPADGIDPAHGSA